MKITFIKLLSIIMIAAFFAAFLPQKIVAQDNVGIGINTPDASAILHLESGNKGLLVPRMNSASRLAIPSPATGLLVYDTDSSCYFFRQPGVWFSLCRVSMGPAGATGTAGIAGATGATGATGAMGVTGADGLAGATGSMGAAGSNGIDGITGPTGTSGNDGTNGIDGVTGVTGSAGSNGTNGIDGITGATGAPGINGTNGIDGVAGPTGAAGATGPTGADGALNAWSLTGNLGTSPPTNFIGTKDLADWVIRTNNSERVRVLSTGNVGINTSVTGSTYLNVTSNDNTIDAIRAFHTSGSPASAYYAVSGNVTNAGYTTATGHLAYHNTANKTFGVYGLGGDLAGYFNGKVGINSISTQITPYDLEVRNTSVANPANVILRQTTSNTLLNSVLGNLDFGDDYNQNPQARIRVFRDVASGAGTDLPTAFSFWTTPDASSTLTERMRIANAGYVGINKTNPTMMLDVAGSSTTSGDAVIRGVSTGNGAVYAIEGRNSSATNDAAALYGSATGNARVHGVLGIASNSFTSASGVRGFALAATGATFGVWGENASDGGVGVYGVATNAAGANGVEGSAWGTGGNGVKGSCNVGAGAYGVWGVSTTGQAGHFSGDVQVVGTLSKTAGTFQIDHPLDPANKYLFHSFVESPDMMNIYNGNMSTDINGEAIVNLPPYFQAENIDFRYQLTVVGQFAQAIILKEVEDNKFVIKTDKPNVKVSWQVTGVRNDKYAQKHRVVPEVEKTGEEKGKYLYPEFFGFGEDRSIESIKQSKDSKK